jgi:hypothetical protein
VRQRGEIAVKYVFFLLTCFSLLGYIHHYERSISATETSITTSLGQAFDIKVGQEVSISSQQLILKFLSVSEDSRCPRGTICMWQGNGKVNIELTATGQTSEVVQLNTAMSLDSEATYLNYKISLLDLRPYPSAESTIQQSEYIATVRVTMGT